jgi:hypothetical protein
MVARTVCLPYMSFSLVQIIVLVYAEDFWSVRFPKGTVILLNYVGHALFYTFLSRHCFLALDGTCPFK